MKANAMTLTRSPAVSISLANTMANVVIAAAVHHPTMIMNWPIDKSRSQRFHSYFAFVS